MKVCFCCGEEKSGLEFNLRHAGDLTRGLQAWCIECSKAYAREYRKHKTSRGNFLCDLREREQIKQDKKEAAKKLNETRPLS